MTHRLFVLGISVLLFFLLHDVKLSHVARAYTAEFCSWQNMLLSFIDFFAGPIEEMFKSPMS